MPSGSTETHRGGRCSVLSVAAHLACVKQCIPRLLPACARQQPLCQRGPIVPGDCCRPTSAYRGPRTSLDPNSISPKSLPGTSTVTAPCFEVTGRDLPTGVVPVARWVPHYRRPPNRSTRRARLSGSSDCATSALGVHIAGRTYFPSQLRVDSLLRRGILWRS